MELWQLILLFMGILIFVVIIYGMARSKKPLKAAIGGICRGLLAFGVMALLLRCSFLSLFGVSIAGAAAHNTGQILAAMAVLGSRAPLVYLPPLLLCSLVTGAVTGGASMLLVHRIPLPGDIKS